MLKIEYEIKLNDKGRPCIELSEDYEHRPEDRFFAIEIARYVLQDVYNRRSKEFDEEAAKTIDITIRLLGQVGDEIARILWNQMEGLGEVDMLLDKKFHITVDNIEERDNIGDYNINNGRLYKKQNGLKVLVADEMKVYELKDDNWIAL